MTDKPQNPADRPAEEQPTPAKSVTTSPGSADEAPNAEREPAGEAAGGPVAPPAKKSGRWFAFLLFLVLLGAVGGLGYYGWVQQQELQSRITELSGQVEGQVNQLSSLSDSMDRVRAEAERALRQASRSAEAREQQNRELRQQVEQVARQTDQQLRGLRDRIRAISTTTTDDWKLAEAYYLTRLAGQRLLMERDTGSALALLQSADRIVRNYPDPDLHPVRSALADDIAALKLADSVDRQGIYLEIAAVSRQIDDLQVSEPVNFQPQENQASTLEEAPPRVDGDNGEGIWQSVKQSFAQALSKLEDFVRVSHHDRAIRPIMSPDQQLYLRSSVYTALDTAQLALMREQPEIYRASLGEAQDLLRELYADSEQRDRILAELSELKDSNITQALPDISDSQEALGDYLDQRHRVAPAGPAQNQNADRQQQDEQP